MRNVYKNRLFEKGVVMERSYIMQQCGRIYNPVVWAKYPFYLTNRIHFIIGGTAYYRQTKRLLKNHLYIFPLNPAFSVSQDATDPVDHIYFDFLSYTNSFFTDIVEVDGTKIPGLIPLMQSVQDSFTSHDRAMELGPAYFQTLIALLRGYIPVNTYKSQVTQAAVDFINTCDVKSLTVESVARNINVNEDHFIRCFRKDMGFTPHKYIAMYKADLATKLIIQGANISETADALGFSSVSSFSTFYKHERHMAPSAVKEWQNGVTFNVQTTIQ